MKRIIAEDNLWRSNCRVSEMTHSQFDLTYFSPKVEKRPSRIEGRGLFAREAIAADRVGQDLGPSEIQVTEDLFIGPTSPDEREGGMMHSHE
jgi:hypothetical protein